MIKILVVDDEQGIRKLLKALLTREGYEVMTASTGEETLKILNSTAFDLMILDLSLPDISGHEICKWVREKSSQKKISILILTGTGNKQNEIDAYNEGGDEYIKKPFSIEEILARIKMVLGRAGIK